MLIVAYIGFGNSVTHYHLPYVEEKKDTIKVKYIYRREEDRIGDTERETWYPNYIFTSNINEVMEDPEVNLVVINTPDAFHVDYSILALCKGKNVLCEKPFALTKTDAQKVFHLAEKNNLVAMANQNRRFDADFLTLKKVIDSGVLGELVELESHYDYFKPAIKENKKFGFLYGLAVHPLDQIISLFGTPNKVTLDCRSIDNPGLADDYYDMDLFYAQGFKATVKTSCYVKIDYPRFILHGKKGSFTMPSLGHNSNKTYKPGPILLEDTVYSESLWGNLSYVSEDGTDVHLKVPIETTNYGAIYDNLLEAIENKQPKIVKNEEVLAVLDIIEQGTIIAKEAVK
ncbi:Gfo/Idh/MocA family oxidoreductase [Enterococcus sp. RIT-PI-f]|uniref:Gfo/Idh/MocA family oxidoreductase n=1 Tax=Enterococcus sp. RIT-PI-f TaxID=1690244 RepID=UPI0006B9C715|nr:Gfo/Idh/MocA family oxidoreductase [Enterococcus sp. RIT-PI-f]KPG68793.1 oxidoreductase [Enterococcus sp. RIT-PI-f]